MPSLLTERLYNVAPSTGVHRNATVVEVKSAPSVGSSRLGAVSTPGATNVSVAVLVAAFHSTVPPSCSPTNLTGSIVRPLTISGTTVAFVESMGSLTPPTVAMRLPIVSPMVTAPAAMVTVCDAASHSMVPPIASTTARIGRSVRPAMMTGVVPLASMARGVPFTVIMGLPIVSVMTVVSAAAGRMLPAGPKARPSVMMSASRTRILLFIGCLHTGLRDVLQIFYYGTLCRATGRCRAREPLSVRCETCLACARAQVGLYYHCLSGLLQEAA